MAGGVIPGTSLNYMWQSDELFIVFGNKYANALFYFPISGSAQEVYNIPRKAYSSYIVTEDRMKFVNVFLIKCLKHMKAEATRDTHLRRFGNDGSQFQISEHLDKNYVLHPHQGCKNLMAGLQDG